jgi:site-specific DNA-methyltransferase (adenine-specific)
MHRLHEGDCRLILPTLPGGSVDCVVTSPPYAEQRAGLYGGVAEEAYPAWAVSWMRQAKRLLRPAGSVLINIREHVRGGQISDYVHRTRLALRADGWLEIDELIWIKPDGMPVGRADRPRRAWERVLWFALSPDCWNDPKANGRYSQRIGVRASPSRNSNDWVHGVNAQSMKGDGDARCPDWVAFSLRHNPDGDWKHPAAHPPELAAWLVRLVCPRGGVVLDPFAGSGTTALAAESLGSDSVLVEQRPEYCAIIRRRLAELRGPLFAQEG